MRPPFERLYDLGDLSQAGTEVVIEAHGDDLASIAQWIGVDAVEFFKAEVELRRLSQSRFALDAHLVADVVQACVVTLEPVRSRLEREVSRRLFLAPSALRKPRGGEEEWPAAPAEDDVAEEISSLRYDLAVPLLEELVLAVDPYPRAPGVVFQAGDEVPDGPESPFAVLKGLKNRP
jgi:uncharacterized metal-binding protein YceD (DUF177 family)